MYCVNTTTDHLHFSIVWAEVFQKPEGKWLTLGYFGCNKCELSIRSFISLPFPESLTVLKFTRNLQIQVSFRERLTLSAIFLFFSSNYLSDQGLNVLSVLAFSTGLWLALIMTMRSILKMLLCYHGWMYEEHGRISNTTKIWLVCIYKTSVLLECKLDTGPQLLESKGGIHNCPRVWLL